MLRPSIAACLESLDLPCSVFRTLGSPSFLRDIYGVPSFIAGNSAVVFRFSAPSGPRFLKCYLRPNPHLRAVYDYVHRLRSPLLPSARFLLREMFVSLPFGSPSWVDVVEGAWTPGDTLTVAVARAVRSRDSFRLASLAASFDSMFSALSAAEWAHGDLKPDNIIVRPDGSFSLIDCDAMWIPSLSGFPAAELGTPPYRHPSRTAADFDKTIDDHPAALISRALRLLSARPSLWPAYSSFEDLLV